MKKHRNIVLVLVLALCIIGTAACTDPAEQSSAPDSAASAEHASAEYASASDVDPDSLPVYKHLSELNHDGAAIGLITGTALDVYCKQYLPKARLEYYNDLAEVLFAISTGQIDATIDDEPMCDYIVKHNEGLTYLDEPVGEGVDTAIAVGKTPFDRMLKEQLNTFIAERTADGTIAEILEIWYTDDEKRQVISMPTEGENGTVKAAVCSQAPPAVMVKDGQLVGSEVDLLAHFCTEYGYRLELTDTDFSGLITGVSSGRFNLACGYLSATEEREELLDFTDTYVNSTPRMIVRTGKQEEQSFGQKVWDGFNRTFIREQRWKLILRGIKITVIISVCSAILGTLLGYGICLLHRRKNPFLHAATSAYIRILQGTPILVIMMILYYIILGQSGLKGEVSAIIAFMLNFAANVAEMLYIGIEDVNVGQTEAAYALGYTKRQTFYRVIMPQAALRFLPVYKNEFISLVKTTSIVGYIAVEDLTKMSDIIRARTYVAFFPLIATAVIYFLLSTALGAVLKMVEIKIEPDRKNRRVKGVVMK